MTAQIDIGVFKDFDSAPTIIFVDLQKEYECETRRLGFRSLKSVIENCERLLSHARQHRYPIVFARWLQPANVFNRNAMFSDWIDGFRPNGSEMVFEHNWPSCYSNTDFLQMMDSGGGRNAVVAGLTSSMACLATIVEGAQRNHKFTFISDASVCHPGFNRTESELHEMATTIISHYADVTNTSQWVSKHAGSILAARYPAEGNNVFK
jgi:nicotinamidase-related amidase